MFTYSTFPAYFPGTDIKTADIEVRVFGSGDDRSMWDVQFYGADDSLHTAPPDQAKAILAYIELNDISAWEEITATAKTNPTLGDALEAA